MIKNITDSYNIILGSKSPRRKELLEKIIPSFNIEIKPVNESYSKNLKREQIALYLSELKAKEFKPDINDLIITADTIVLLNKLTFGKPNNKNDAIKIPF